MDDPPVVTSDDIHNVAFSNPPRGHRGYHEDEVDAFLERVETTLRDPTARGVTVAEIHNVTFSKPPIGQRGYHEDEVDAFLRRVALELARRTAQRPVVDALPGAPQTLGAPTAAGPRHLKPSDESTAQKIWEHIGAFAAELSPTNHYRFTWRTPLVIGLVFLLLGVAVHLAYLVIGVGLLVVAVVAWRSQWGD